MSLHRLLLVEDDADMAAMLAAYLQRHGLHVTRADSRATALAALRGGRVDLILLDVSLGDDDGVAICAEIREAQDVPIIMVSALSADHQRMAGYEVGADDYIAKPFSQRLLIARIRAILRRAEYAKASTEASEPAAEPIVRGRLEMDPARHRVKWNGEDVTLTVTEFLILEALAQRPGVVKNRNQLMDAAYQDDVYVDDRTIDSHIKRLRRKFRETDSEFNAIDTLYGAGYRFAEE